MGDETNLYNVATLRHINWSERNIKNCWDSTLYELYSNRLLFITDTRYANGSKIDSKQTTSVTQEDYNKIIEYLDKIKDSIFDIAGCDGDAWEVDIYSENESKVHINAGYVYGNETFTNGLVPLLDKYNNISL